MKMTRTKLKGIVKECLVEILAEGLSSNGSMSLNKKPSRPSRETVERENRRLEEHRESLDRRIDETVASLTNDSVMSEILADTARTTLQEQINHEGNGGAGGPGINIDNIFSESTNNWSKLAFPEK